MIVALKSLCGCPGDDLIIEDILQGQPLSVPLLDAKGSNRPRIISLCSACCGVGQLTA